MIREDIGRKKTKEDKYKKGKRKLMTPKICEEEEDINE